MNDPDGPHQSAGVFEHLGLAFVLYAFWSVSALDDPSGLEYIAYYTMLPLLVALLGVTSWVRYVKGSGSRIVAYSYFTLALFNGYVAAAFPVWVDHAVFAGVPVIGGVAAIDAVARVSAARRSPDRAQLPN